MKLTAKSRAKEQNIQIENYILQFRPLFNGQVGTIFSGCISGKAAIHKGVKIGLHRRKIKEV